MTEKQKPKITLIEGREGHTRDAGNYIEALYYWPGNGVHLGGVYKARTRTWNVDVTVHVEDLTKALQFLFDEVVDGNFVQVSPPTHFFARIGRDGRLAGNPPTDLRVDLIYGCFENPSDE